MPFFNKKLNRKSDLTMSTSRRTLGLVALEPRVLLDAAGVVTGAEGVIDALCQQEANTAISNLFQPQFQAMALQAPGDHARFGFEANMEARLRDNLHLLGNLNAENISAIDADSIRALTQSLSLVESIDVAEELVVEKPVVSEQVEIGKPLVSEVLGVSEIPGLDKPIIYEPATTEKPVIYDPVDVQKPIIYENIQIEKPAVYEDMVIGKPIISEFVEVDKSVVYELVQIEKPVVYEGLITEKPLVYEPAIFDGIPVSENPFDFMLTAGKAGLAGGFLVPPVTTLPGREISNFRNQDFAQPLVPLFGFSPAELLAPGDYAQGFGNLSFGGRDFQAILEDLIVVGDPIINEAQPISVVFVDTSVAGYETILETLGTDVEIVLIDPSEDGIEVMAEYLEGRTDIDAIHIISHGRAGNMTLGNSNLTTGSINGEYVDELALIGNALTASGDILIYGCDFGADAAAVAALAAATGADIAASNDDTGLAELGGDWELEVKSGDIEAAAIEATEFAGLLAPLTISTTAQPTLLNGTPFNVLTSFSAGDQVIWTNAGTVGGVAINLIATVVSVDPGVHLSFQTSGDDPTVVLLTGADLGTGPLGANAGSAVIVWSIVETATGDPAFGTPEFTVSDIDGSGLPNTIETVAPDMDGLQSIVVDGATALDITTSGGVLTASGTDEAGAATRPSAAIRFTWAETNSWQISYTAHRDADGRLFNHDGDGDFVFGAGATTIIIPQIDLDGDDSSGATGADYEGNYTLGDAGVPIGDAIGGDVSITVGVGVNVTTATVSLGNAQAGDVLTVGALPAGITVDPASTATNIILIGNASAADYETAIEAITFANANTGASAVDRTLTVEFTEDQTFSSNNATSTLHINTLPTAQGNDETTTEDAGSALSGNVVTDIDPTNGQDNDPGGDPLSVTDVDGTAIPGPGTTNIVGTFGTLTMGTDGSYSYAVDNGNAAVHALAVGQSLTETYTYTIDDGNGGTDTAVLTITINGTNDVPDAVNDIEITGENTVHSDSVLVDNGNGVDSDPDGDTLTITLVNGAALSSGAVITLPSGALLTMNDDGTYDFDPNGAFENLGVGQNTTDSFTYTIDDGNGGTDTAIVTFTITGVNDAPVAENNTVSVNEDGAPVTGNVVTDIDPVDGVDADVDGDTLVVSDVDGTAIAGPGTTDIVGTLGTLTIAPDGSYSFAVDNANPVIQALAVGQSTTETFTYTIDDGNGGTDTAVLTITINGTNDVPTAVDDTDSTDEDTAISITAANGVITPNDTDPDAADSLFVSAVEGNAGDVGNQITLASGALLTLYVDGSYDYDPNGAFESLAIGDTDTDSFTYTVSDGNGGTDTATVTITINGVNDAPIAQPDGETTDEDTAFSDSVLVDNGNGVDADPDTGDTLTITEVNGLLANVGVEITLASGALLTVNPDGSYDYDPNGQFESLGVGDTATDTFTYQISDGNGGTDTETVTITINGVNDAPTAQDDTETTDEDTVFSDSVLPDNGNGADSDPESNTLTVTQVNGTNIVSGGVITLPSGAQLTMNTDGTYDYDPNGAFESLAVGETDTDSFTYQISDGNGGFDTATVTFTITGVNDAPIAVADGYSTDEDTAISINTAGGIVDTNDTDVDASDTLTVTLVDGLLANVGAQITLASGALLTVNADGSFDYDPNGQFESLNAGDTATETFTYQISDGNGGTDTETVTITINGVADAPTLTNDDDGSSGAPVTDYEDTYIENGLGIALVDSDALVNDADGDIVELVITLTNGQVGDTINFPSMLPGNITATAVPSTTLGAAGTIVLTFTGDASTTNADWNALLQALNFLPSITDAHNPDPSDRNFTFQVSDSQGNLSNLTNTIIHVVAENDPPTLDLDDGNTSGTNAGNYTGTFTEDAGPVAIHSDILLTDLDDTNFESAQVVLTNPQTGDQMLINGVVVAVGDSGTVNGIAYTVTTNGSGELVIDLTGTATLADYDAALELITFNNTSDDPDTTQRVITVSVNDGDNDSPTRMAFINVVPVNDPPVLDIALADQATTDGNTTFTVPTAGNFSDPDDVNLTYSLAPGAPAWIAIDPMTGVVTTTGVPADASQNSNIGGGADGTYDITVVVTDPDGLSAQDTFQLNVINFNPVAVDDVSTADEDTVQFGNVITDAVTGDADSPPDSDVLTVTAVTGGSVDTPQSLTYGDLTINADGSWTFTPNAAANALAVGESAQEVVTYTIDDGNGGTDTATLTINITGVNDAPIAQPDSETTDEDTDFSDSVLTDNGSGVDADPDASDTLTVTEVNGTAIVSGGTITLPSGALLVMNGDGTYDYDPNGQFENLAVTETTTDSFTYTIDDGNGGTDTETVTITITGVNDTPTAQDDAETTDENTVLSGENVLADNGNGADSDPDGSDVLNISEVNGTAIVSGDTITLPSGAILTMNDDGTYDYDPNGQFENLAVGATTTDSFTYTIDDGNGGTDTATVTITITGVNDAPIAEDDAVTGDEDSVSTGSVFVDNGSGVDSDPDGDVFVVSAVGGNAGGVGNAVVATGGGLITINADGTYSFDPSGDFEGLGVGETATTSLTYTIDDGEGGTDTATITVTVQGINDAPIVTGTLTGQTGSDSVAQIPFDASTVFSDPDVETLTFSSPDLPIWMSIDPATGIITGTPPADASQGGPLNDGVYTVTVTATDPDGETVSTTVTYTFANPAPVVDTSILDQAALDNETISIPSDISDPDGDTLTYSATGLPAGLSIDPATGEITGTIDNSASQGGPASDGVYTITVTADDGEGGTVTDTFDLTVSNPAPIAEGDAVTGDEDSVSTGDLFADNGSGADTDSDGDVFTITEVNGVSANVGAPIAGDTGGEFTINPDGTYSFDPNGDFDDLAVGETRDTTITYTIDDGEGGTDTATVTLTVSGVNDAPEPVDPITGNPPADPTDYIPAQTGDDSDPTTPLDLTPYFTDPDGSDILTISVDPADLPPGMTFDPLTGIISGTPDADASQGGVNGVYTIPVTVDDGNGGTFTTNVVYTISNPAPIAEDDAVTGDEDSISTGSVFVDNGSGVDSDPDGDTFTVSEVGGVAANVGTPIAGDTGGEFTINPDGTYSFDPNGDFEGLDVGETATTSITYTIDDGEGGTDTATITVTVTGVNDAPIVTGTLTGQAGSDSVAQVPFDASTVFSDPDVETLTFSSPDLPTWMSIDPVTGIITGTPPADASQGGPLNDGVYEVTVTATDPDGEIVSTTVTYTFTNPPPVVDVAVGPQAAEDSETIFIPVDFSDPDGDTLSYSATGLPAGLSVDPVTGEITGTIDPSASQGGPNSDGVYTITVTADDGEGGTVTDTFDLTVSNPAPVVDTPIVDQTAEDNETISIPSVISDPDGDTLAYSATGLPTGLSIDPATGEITGTIDNSASQGGVGGVYTITVTADDGEGGTVTDTFDLTVTNPAPIAEDDAVTGDEDTVSTGDLFADNGSGVDADPDGDVFTVTEVNGVPANVGAPIAGDTGGAFTINPDGTYSFDPSGDFDDLAVGETRDTTITYTIDDGEGGTDTATVTLTVGGVNDAPEPVDPLTGNPPADPTDYIPAQTGDDSDPTTPLDLTPYFTDPDGSDVLTISVDPADLPPGMSFNTLTGIISGTPDTDASQGGVNGVYTIPVTVDDGNGGTFTTNVVYTISNPAPIAEDDAVTGDEDSVSTGDLFADNGNGVDADPDGDTFTVSEVGGVPANVGTPTAGDNGGEFTINPDGTYSFDPSGDFDDLAVGEARDTTITYTIDDGEGGTDTATVTLTVSGVNDAPEPVDPTTGNPPADPADYIPAQTGDDSDPTTPLDLTPYFTDPDGSDVLTISVDPADLPPGMSFDPLTGIISGTPDADASQGGVNGVYTIPVTVDDGNGGTFTTNVTYVISNPAPIALDDGPVDITEDEALVLDVLGNDNDPDGDVVTITEINGLPITVGGSVTLPSGSVVTLNPDGALEYDPAENLNGPDTFEYTITDADGASDTASVDVNILPVNDTPETDANLPDQLSEDGETIDPIDVSGSFSDIDGDPLTFTATGLPPGLVLDPATGIISGTLEPGASADGPYTVIVTATDPDGDSIATGFVWGVDNVKPVVSEPIGPQTGVDGQPVTIPTADNFEDPDGDDLTYTVTGLPDGLAIDPATGVITGTLPSDSSVGGPYTIIVTATDSDGDSVSETFELTVTNPAPTIAELPPIGGNVGEPFTLDVGVVTNDPDGDDLSFTATGLPQGLTIDPLTGVISGTPTVPADGPYVVVITVSDGQGGTAVQTLELIVNEDPYVPESKITELLPLGKDVVGKGKSVGVYDDGDLGRQDGAVFDLRRVFEEREDNQTLSDVLDEYNYRLRGGMATSAEISGLEDGASISVEAVAHANSIFVGLSETISAMTNARVTGWHVDMSGRSLPAWVDYQDGRDFITLNRPLSQDTIVLRIQAVLADGRRVGGNFEIDLRTGEVEMAGHMQAQSLTMSEQFVQIAENERSKDKALMDALSG